jgi:hypothetical protein
MPPIVDGIRSGSRDGLPPPSLARRGRRILGGTLGGKTALAGAIGSFPPLIPAYVLPAQRR